MFGSIVIRVLGVSQVVPAVQNALQGKGSILVLGEDHRKKEMAPFCVAGPSHGQKASATVPWGHCYFNQDLTERFHFPFPPSASSVVKPPAHVGDEVSPTGCEELACGETATLQ